MGKSASVFCIIGLLTIAKNEIDWAKRFTSECPIKLNGKKKINGKKILPVLLDDHWILSKYRYFSKNKFTEWIWRVSIKRRIKIYPF